MAESAHPRCSSADGSSAPAAPSAPTPDWRDAIGELVVRRDAAGRICEVNAAFRRAFGGEACDWVGRWLAAPHAEAGRGGAGGRRRREAAHETVEGPAWIEWEETRLPDGGAIAVGRDVSARRAGEDALRVARAAAEAAAQARETLFASVTHELRTPLIGVLGMADLLARTPLTAEQASHLAAIAESGRHLLGVVDDLLDAAKLEAGAFALAPEPMDPGEILQSVVELLAPRARAKGLEIAALLDPRRPRLVQGDPHRWRQIALNLLGNAVKFTPSGGVVAALHREDAASPADGEAALRMSVRDTGPGVPAADRARIFEAFAQADASPARRADGAGLGLAIVRRLADAMGGQAGLETPEGGGSEFWVRASFPVLAEPDPATAARLAGRRVLVACQEQLTAGALVRQLAALGAEATFAADAGAAERALAAQPDRVALVDRGLAEVLSAQSARAAIILAGPDERDAIARARAAGYAGWLVKPCRLAALVERVEAAWSGETAPPAADPLDAAGRDGTPARNGAAAAVRRETAPAVRIARPEEQSAPASPTKSAGRLGQGAAVLLVEDNPINQRLARAQLGRLGAEVTLAENGAAALAACARTRFDIVFMDMRLPEMDGLEATRRLRAAGVSAPVVALTANASEADRRACLAAGMAEFLTKPVEEAALAAVIERFTGPAKRANVG